MQLVTHIIHHTPTVDFDTPLSSFEDEVAGVRKLIDISACADHRIRLLVTSSISVASEWDPMTGPVPERPLPELAVAVNNGHSAFGYVVEQVKTNFSLPYFNQLTEYLYLIGPPRGQRSWYRCDDRSHVPNMRFRRHRSLEYRRVGAGIG